MADKAMLVPLPGDGPLAREVLRQVKAEAERRAGRPIGAKTAGEFAQKLKNARYLDQQDARRTA